jgi:hypothetical protein
VFPSSKGGQLHRSVPKVVIQQLRGTTETAHGCRSTFVEWCDEEAHVQETVREKCLAHKVKDATVGLRPHRYDGSPRARDAGLGRLRDRPGLVTRNEPNQLMQGYYAFGSNQLHIMKALGAVIDYLEAQAGVKLA